MRRWLLVLLLPLVVACQTTSRYDQSAYDKQTFALASVLKLMDKATLPYDSQQAAIDATVLAVEDAYQYDRNRPGNKPTVDQWDLIRDPARSAFAGFLKLWKQKGKLPQVYIDEKKKQVADDFDQITGLEGEKIK